MRKRTHARELALQALYQIRITEDPVRPSLDQFWADRPEADSGVREFCEQLVIGITAEIPVLDQLIARASENWDLHRMALLDLLTMRLGTYELLHGETVPAKVAINEAIDLAKRFGTEDSSKFVNGVLDRIHKREIPQLKSAPSVTHVSE